MLEPALWDFGDDFFGLANIHREASAANFKETDKAFFFALDMPGVNKKGLDIQVEGGHVVIHTVRKLKFAEGKDDAESVTKTVAIPKEADRENIQAHCEDGVLYLAIPKARKARPRKIEVGEGAKNNIWNKLIGRED